MEEKMRMEPLVTNVEGLCKMLGVGRRTALNFAEEAGARIDMGTNRILRFSIPKIREYLETKTY